MKERYITEKSIREYARRFMKASYSPVKFSDVDAGHWAYLEICTAVSNGWINGYTDGSFKPDAPITRAEAVAVINRMLGRGVNKSSKLGNFKNFSDNADAKAWYYYEIIEAANGHEYEGERPSENWTRNGLERSYDIDKYERP